MSTFEKNPNRDYLHLFKGQANQREISYKTRHQPNQKTIMIEN